MAWLANVAFLTLFIFIAYLLVWYFLLYSYTWRRCFIFYGCKLLFFQFHANLPYSFCFTDQAHCFIYAFTDLVWMENCMSELWKKKGCNGAETNYRIARSLCILLMNSNCFAISNFQQHSSYVCSDFSWKERRLHKCSNRSRPGRCGLQTEFLPIGHG